MHNRTYRMILVSLFAALTAVGAFFKIPLPPVPFTLQLFFVIFAGLLLGPKLGFATQAIYIAIGLAGVPIFAYGGGIQYVLHPTFGYLIGYMAAAFAAGWVSQRICPEKPTFAKLFIAALAGLAACYIIGVPYLFFIMKFINHADTTAGSVLVKGFLLFLPWDIVKMGVAAWLSKEVHGRMRWAAKIRYGDKG